MKTKNASTPKATNPFAEGVEKRYRHMGLVDKSGKVDPIVVESMGRMYAGLFYDQLCESYDSNEDVSAICVHMIERAKDATAKQILLTVSLQYDAMGRTLPEVIWWISGSADILPVFIVHFVNALIALYKEGSAAM